MRRSNYLDQLADQVRRIYEAGASIRTTADACQLSYQRTRQIMLEYEIPRRPAKGVRKVQSAENAQHARRIAKTYGSGMTLTQTAAHCGLSIGRTRRIMAAFGIPVRPRSATSVAVRVRA